MSARREPREHRPHPREREPQPFINRWFDGFAASHDHMLGLDAPAYLVMGVGGIAVGFSVLVALSLANGVPVSVAVGVLGLSLATFVVAGLVRKKLRRKARHVLLEDVVLVLASCGAFARFAGQTPWRVLDALAVGLGAFLVFGRVGCFASGCCHGRPSEVGIRYPKDTGVAPLLVGIRLFPLQLVEAIWLASVTFASLLFALFGAQGLALRLFLIAYGAGRFVLELARGDDARPRLGSLWEAQWIALALLVGVAVADELAVRVDRARVSALLAATLIVLVGVATRRHWMTLPKSALDVDGVRAWERFLCELTRERSADRAVEHAVHDTPTSGVRIGLLMDPVDGGRWIHSYSLRRGDGMRLEERTAYTLSGMIAQRLPPHEILRAGYSDAGVFHMWVLIEAPDEPPGSSLHDPAELVLLRARAFASAVRATPPFSEAGVATGASPASTASGATAESAAAKETRTPYFGLDSSQDG